MAPPCVCTDHSLSRRYTTTKGDTTLIIGPQKWELRRSATQVGKDGEASQTQELYEGVVLDVDLREDQLLYGLRNNNLAYRAEVTAQATYVFTAQVTYEATAKPIKGNRYAINSSIGECKAGDEVMTWHVSIDSDEIWSQDRGGETKSFRAACIVEDKDGEKEVHFCPDEKGWWTRMELAKTVG